MDLHIRDNGIGIPEADLHGDVGSQRSFLFFNEELAKYVAFDLIPGEDETQILFEFVSIEPDEADMLQSIIRH